LVMIYIGIAIDPQDPDRIFAGTGEGLLIGIDAGNVNIFTEYILIPITHAKIYTYVDEAGNPIYLSTDGGKSFKPIGKGLPRNGTADRFCIHPDHPEILFYGGEVGRRRRMLFISIDGGET